MRYAVIADIHSNLQALQAVLDDIEEMGADRMFCVGDVVGYGADPAECVGILREIEPTIVAGNHDWAVTGRSNIEYFNADAHDSVLWTREQLTQEDIDYLDGMSLVETVGDIVLVHSSTMAPEHFDYIRTLYDVQLTFEHLAGEIAFVGHSHVPVMFTETNPPECFLLSEYKLVPGLRTVVNVGSIGQPRDLDSRACYAIYDSDEQTVYMRRVEYDVITAAERITAAGLPPTNAARIALGR